MSAYNSTGLCLCGCGEKTNLAVCSNRNYGWVINQPVKFIHGHNSRKKNLYRKNKNGCWNWLLAKSKLGYGFKWNLKSGNHIPAHRYMYEKLKGAIPHGLELDHLCRNPSCVNPKHLEPVTRTENRRRSKDIKLSLEKAKLIRYFFKNGIYGRKELAIKYGVHEFTINKIIRMELWT